MFEKVFKEILRETQVMALRHKSENEAEDLVNKIKSAIENHRFEILPRDKNRDFIKNRLKTDFRGAIEKIYSQIEPRNFVAVLENRNSIGGELYLFTLKLDGKLWTYMKVDIKDEFITVVSFHGQNEKVYVDYRKSIDNQMDLSYLKCVAKDWIFRYNNRNLENKMVDYDLTQESILLKFQEFPGKEILEDLVASCPRDKGLKVYQLKVIPHKDSNQLEIIIPERDNR